MTRDYLPHPPYNAVGNEGTKNAKKSKREKIKLNHGKTRIDTEDLGKILGFSFQQNDWTGTNYDFGITNYD